MSTVSKLTISALSAAIIAAVSCKPAETTSDENAALKVVATVGMIGDVSAEIGGEKVSVATLMGAGVDPHLYKSTVADVKQLDAADIIFRSGLMLEGRMGDTLQKMGKRGKAVHAVAEDALKGENYVVGDDDGHHDPHVWMDVSAWAKVTAQIAGALAAADQENAAFYQDRDKAYQERLVELDAYARKTLAGIPAERRVLVTSEGGHLACRASIIRLKS